MDIFQEARERVPAERAARFYGLELDAGGRKARCPFHDDRHPSLTFRNGRWRCWVCNIGGSSIDLVARLYGLEPKEAVKRLNADFALGLPTDRPPTPQQAREIQQRQECTARYRAFEDWRMDTIAGLDIAQCRCRELEQGIRTPEDLERLTPEEAWAATMEERLEYVRQSLAIGSPEEQAELYREKGRINEWIERVSSAWNGRERSGRA